VFVTVATMFALPKDFIKAERLKKNQKQEDVFKERSKVILLTRS
jgi:hypothetical protein